MSWKDENVLKLDTSKPIWHHFFTVAPLVVIGTREGDAYDMAPKHMVSPLGHDNYFGFVCTPRHSTYHNVAKEGAFTVSFPKPGQVTLASLAASPRCWEESEHKPVLEELPTLPAPNVDARFLDESYLFLECRHMKTIDGFGDYSLICGEITGAYIDKSYKRVSEVDEQEFIADSPLLAYLAYGRFAEIRESFAFPLPKDFKY
ncbi:MAG: flavin reductase [Saprospiraceae bacterium]|nr:flavin reductase [Saprospiraceae bacterium]